MRQSNVTMLNIQLFLFIKMKNISYSIRTVFTTAYMYLLSSITRVSVNPPLSPPPNTIIQLVVGVTFHTERD